MRAPLKYNVVPRYTAGSPAAVDLYIADQVAREERRAYQAHLEGYYGEEEKQRAERLGLGGIVYYYTERSRAPRVSMTDMLLETRTDFRTWDLFAAWSKANREATAAPLTQEVA